MIVVNENHKLNRYKIDKTDKKPRSSKRTLKDFLSSLLT